MALLVWWFLSFSLSHSFIFVSTFIRVLSARKKCYISVLLKISLLTPSMRFSSIRIFEWDALPGVSEESWKWVVCNGFNSIDDNFMTWFCSLLAAARLTNLNEVIFCHVNRRGDPIFFVSSSTWRYPGNGFRRLEKSHKLLSNRCRLNY